MSLDLSYEGGLCIFACQGIFFADVIPYAIKYWKYIMSCLSHLKEISIICPDNASVPE